VPRGNHISGVDLLGLLNLLVVLGIVFLPMIVCRRGPEPGESDSEDSGPDDGWRKRPPSPPTPPTPPRGGVPLDDAEPSRTRLRDHGRLADARSPRQRRPAREPVRRPVRTRTHH
jgi:hypothetical protein